MFWKKLILAIFWPVIKVAAEYVGDKLSDKEDPYPERPEGK